MKNDSILIRTCQGFDELRACVDMQINTWGYDATDVIPLKAFLVAQKIGGQAIGAFDLSLNGVGSHGTPDSMIGFAFSLPGVKSPTHGIAWPYLHSHMLAVKDEYRNRGIGRALKLEQRREALARGIRHMEWTFDPLEIKNAHLNLTKLGARCRRYAVDFYGHSTSKLQAGLPTDRLFAEWSLDSPAVNALLDGSPTASKEKSKAAERIMLPAEISQWKLNSRENAQQLQYRNRELFQSAFSRGLAVIGFEIDAAGNGSYLLGSEG